VVLGILPPRFMMESPRMRRRFAIVGAASMLWGCEAPLVAVTAPDTGADTAAVEDTADTAPPPGVDAGITDVFFADGAPCRGHDEDHDGIPDLCDDCPGIYNPAPGQIVGRLPVGTLCNALPSDGFAFDRAGKRLFFDAFTDYASDWKSSGGGVAAFVIGDDNDSMEGGTGDDDFRYLVRRAAAGAGTTVATTVVHALGGFKSPLAGVLVRAIGDPKHFYMCFVGNGRFGVLTTPPGGCTGGPCAYTVLSDKPVPLELSAEPESGLRISVSTGALPAVSGRVECLIFHSAQPLSLHNGDERYVVRVDLDETSWIPSGEVGLATLNYRTRFAWLDVLSEP
jgi:hypothetical protein